MSALKLSISAPSSLTPGSRSPRSAPTACRASASPSLTSSPARSIASRHLRGCVLALGEQPRASGAGSRRRRANARGRRAARLRSGRARRSPPLASAPRVRPRAGRAASRSGPGSRGSLPQEIRDQADQRAQHRRGEDRRGGAARERRTPHRARRSYAPRDRDARPRQAGDCHPHRDTDREAGRAPAADRRARPRRRPSTAITAAWNPRPRSGKPSRTAIRSIAAKTQSESVTASAWPCSPRGRIAIGAAKDDHEDHRPAERPQRSSLAVQALLSTGSCFRNALAVRGSRRRRFTHRAADDKAPSGPCAPDRWEAVIVEGARSRGAGHSGDARPRRVVTPELDDHDPGADLEQRHRYQRRRPSAGTDPVGIAEARDRVMRAVGKREHEHTAASRCQRSAARRRSSRRARRRARSRRARTWVAKPLARPSVRPTVPSAAIRTRSLPAVGIERTYTCAT